MRSLSGLGIGLSLLFGFLFLALVAEVYYLLWWKKRMIASTPSRRITDEEYSTSAREFLDLFCWKKSSSIASAPFTHREICTSVRIVDGSEGGQLSLDPNACKDSSFKPLVGGGGGEEEGLDAELMRLHNLSGPPRILFTIKEETKEDLESEDGRPRRRTLSDLLLVAESPFLTPFSSPPLFPPPHLPPPHAPHLPSYDKHGFNPLFESHLENEKKWMWPSPPPKFKFLRDAEEKLYRKTLVEEALKVHSFGMTNQSNLANISPPEISASVVKGDTLTTISPSVLGAQRNDVLIECPC